MNKKEKKNAIQGLLDLAGGRYKDDEVDTLFDMVDNSEKYDGITKIIKNSFTDWCSEGKYSRYEETKYTLKSDNDGLRIEENYSYHDDDGDSGSFERTHNTGRDFLNIFKKHF